MAACAHVYASRVQVHLGQSSRQGLPPVPGAARAFVPFFPTFIIVRLGGVEVSVMEVRGLEVEQPIMGAFAAVLNALDFPVQLLAGATAPAPAGRPPGRPG